MRTRGTGGWPSGVFRTVTWTPRRWCRSPASLSVCKSHILQSSILISLSMPVWCSETPIDDNWWCFFLRMASDKTKLIHWSSDIGNLKFLYPILLGQNKEWIDVVAIRASSYWMIHHMRSSALGKAGISSFPPYFFFLSSRRKGDFPVIENLLIYHSKCTITNETNITFP